MSEEAVGSTTVCKQILEADVPGMSHRDCCPGREAK